MSSLDIFNPPLDIRPGARQQWGGLAGASLGLAIANSARRFQGLTLVVTENTQQAERLHSELEFFLEAGPGEQALEVLDFPDWETLP